MVFPHLKQVSVNLVLLDEVVLGLEPITKPDQPVKERLGAGEEGDEAHRGQLADLGDTAAAADVQVGQKIGNLKL